MTGSIPAPVSAARYAARRARVQQQLSDRAVLVVAATPELRVGRDAELRYVVDSDLYYLTGYTEPDAVLVLRSDAMTLFVRPRDAHRELWAGRRGGVEAARLEFGADEAFAIDELSKELPRLLRACDRIYTRLRTGRDDVDRILTTAVEDARLHRARTAHGIAEVVDTGALLDELRLHKDAEEIAQIRHAADISMAAFREAGAAVRAGAGEWQVEAALQYGFRSRRASGEAFSSIVARGANATILHYTENNDVICDGDLVLIDAGARYGMYCADITRTYAAGAVSAERAAAHDIVRAAHSAAIAAAQPGATIDGVDSAARHVLVQGMIDLGLLDGTVDDALQGNAYKRYYPHRTSHWLGLDVHDVGGYMVDDAPRPLVEGMVFTVEPGLYIPADDERAPQGLRGVGIRLEDDVLITASGADVLTASLALGMEGGIG